MSRSLWKIHGEILNIAPSRYKVASADRTDETARIGSLTLPPLSLSKEQQIPLRGRIKTWAPLAMAAAVVLGLTVSFSYFQEEDLRAKGGHRYLIFAERGGQVFQLKEGEKAQAGDRLRVEVVAASAASFYLTVLSKDMQTLLPWDDVLNHVLTTESMDRKAFPGSVRLDEKDEGETLLVVVCDRSVARGEAQAFIEAATKDRSVDRTPCSKQAFPLR